MTEFSIWAKHANIQTMQLVIFDEDDTVSKVHEIQKGEKDIWSIDLPDAGLGTLYKFRVNGNEADTIPDPRSKFQPRGVNGPSIVVNHDYKWQAKLFKAPPLSEALLYEMHIGTFTAEGTYDAAVEKLDYLAKLGIKYIELLPLAQASGAVGWGYDGVDLFAPNHSYGTPERLKNFVDECHKRKMGVIHDVVYNHFGPEGNMTGKVAPYLAKARTPWGDAINFDTEGSEHVRAFVVDNALMWLREYNMDGLRLDAVDNITDESPQHIVAQISEAVDELSASSGRQLLLFAEFDKNDPKATRPRSESGWGIGTQWADNFHHAVRTVISGDLSGYYQDFGSLQQLGKALSQAIVYEGEYSKYHDREHGKPYGVLPSTTFLVSDQNHDQVGNRAMGDRLEHALDNDRAKLAPALVLLSRFVPMLFMGEEWAASTPWQFFSDHQDAGNAIGTTEGRTHQFEKFGFKAEDVPDPQNIETFRRSKLNWNELEQGKHKETLEWYSNLIKLRQAVPDFGVHPTVKVSFDEDRKWLKFSHSGITAAFNFAEEERHVPFTASEEQNILLVSKQGYRIEGDHLIIPGNTVVITTQPEMKAKILEAAPELADGSFAPELRRALGERNDSVAPGTQPRAALA